MRTITEAEAAAGLTDLFADKKVKPKCPKCGSEHYSRATSFVGGWKMLCLDCRYEGADE